MVPSSKIGSVALFLVFFILPFLPTTGNLRRSSSILQISRPHLLSGCAGFGRVAVIRPLRRPPANARRFQSHGPPSGATSLLLVSIISPGNSVLSQRGEGCTCGRVFLRYGPSLRCTGVQWLLLSRGWLVMHSRMGTEWVFYSKIGKHEDYHRFCSMMIRCCLT
jgi:hypothetical protein